MRIYKILSDFEKFLSFSIDNGELFSKMPDFSAKFRTDSRLNEWVKPKGSFYQSDNFIANKISIPDITTWLSGNLVLNKKAFSSLKTFIDEYGEFLEVDCEGITYYIFNCLKILPDNFIDKNQTREKIVSGIYMGLESVAFKEVDLNMDEYMLFKTNADKLSSLYCTELFVDFVNTNGFKGLLFSKDLTV